ncbi:TPA: retron St85 family effector protein, partial [Legionella pneumophila]|nr:retron St85 family effector protein [Legionella pneumophila]
TFLCGGNSCDENHFRPKLEKALKDKNINVVLAEEAFSWDINESFNKDLLEFEKYYGSLVSSIPLVCESYGSAAELGAFVTDHVIKNKLIILIQNQYFSGKDNNSFIRHGPIQHHIKNGYKYIIFSDINPHDELDEICTIINNYKPETINSNFSHNYFKILLVLDLINVLAISSIDEIKIHAEAVLKKFDKNYEINRKTVKEMLFVLKKLDLV